MVPGGADAALPEDIGELLGLFPVPHIDDAAAGNRLEDGQELALFVLAAADDVGEVFPLETADFQVLFPEGKPLHDVFRHDRGRGRRESDDRRVDPAADLPDFQVVRPEIIAPLRDTVGFVHHDEGNVHPSEPSLEEAGGEPFGGEVEELVVAVGGVVQGQLDILPVHAGVDRNGADPALGQVLDLVFHQGDERGDDERDSLFHQGGNLEADGFSAAGRKDGKHVPSREGILDDVLLHGPERFVAPIGLQYLFRRHNGYKFNDFDWNTPEILINLRD